MQHTQYVALDYYEIRIYEVLPLLKLEYKTGQRLVCTLPQSTL